MYSTYLLYKYEQLLKLKNDFSNFFLVFTYVALKIQFY